MIFFSRDVARTNVIIRGLLYIIPRVEKASNGYLISPV